MDQAIAKTASANQFRNRFAFAQHRHGPLLVVALCVLASMSERLSAETTTSPVVVVTVLRRRYAFALVSHFFIEKNRPASFTYPLWSFIADWKMWALILTGRINAELLRHGIAPVRQAPTSRPTV